MDSYLESGFAHPVALRYKGKAGGAWVTYGLTRDQVEPEVSRWTSEGASRSLIVVNELAEDHRLALQGEVRRSERHLDLRYSRAPKPMRVAFAEKQEHTDGLQALLLLRYHMSPASYDDLDELLSVYADSVIEFSAYKMDVGDKRGRNTIFWEVRNY